ncbi:uncharacterized protein LOC143898889 [Temnothorax americanus]|uniref:uncharacterized protein LOC143898889 n=1 Tax=Temnothorax americanus TaxID=1964332 RepID=UPI0040675AD8
MSGENSPPRTPIANASWLINKFSPRVNSPRATTQATLDNVRVALETRHSDSETELPENVVTEREFPFGEIDESLFSTDPIDRTDEKPRRSRPYVSRTPSRVSLRREFSLTSYESDIFDPSEYYRENGEETRTEKPLLEERTHTNQPQAQVKETEMAQSQSDAQYAPLSTETHDVREIYNLLREMQKMQEESRIEMRDETRELRERLITLENSARNGDQVGAGNERYSSENYGRTEHDIRNRRSSIPNAITLKEARSMIPEFDGTSRQKLQEFINACTYAVHNIQPTDEESLVQAILYTKLKGKAMQDFETRDIQTFAQLKQQLEACYQAKQSTTHLQIEFNTLKQKPNESAHAFGQRVDLLAMKLYDAMIEGEDHSSMFKRAIQQTIQKQALINFQIGLRDELKILVRSQRYATLQEAITGASAEEKLIGPTATKTGASLYKNKPGYTRQPQNQSVQCFKCGKTGHYGRECRSQGNALPKPSKPAQVNALQKYCNYCKKSGHNRDECWTLKGRSYTPNTNKSRENEKRQQLKVPNRRKNADSASSEDEQEEARGKQPRPASEYRVTHIESVPYGRTKPELLLTRLPILEVKPGASNMLYDSGSTISLIKLNALKDDASVYEDRIALTGITGHKIHTIGKVYATIETNKLKIKHAFYVVGEDMAIEYDGILGIDFLRTHAASCDYEQMQLKIKEETFKLHPYGKVTLKPRSETIIEAITDKNEEGIVQAREMKPGVYIGNCLVKPENHICIVSIINTTDKEIEIPIPQVTLEKLETDTHTKIHATMTGKETKPAVSRNERI